MPDLDANEQDAKLSHFIRFGLIRAFPAIAGITILPILYGVMGPEQYGTYSLISGYALIIISVAGAIANQPIYRFASNLEQDRRRHSFMSSAAAITGGACTLAGTLLYTGEVYPSATLTLFVVCAVKYSTLCVKKTVTRSFVALFCLELARITALVICLWAQAAGPEGLSANEAFAALALSYLAPCLFQLKALRSSKPTKEWAKQKAAFGATTAIWLLLSGTPWLAGKYVMEVYGSSEALGDYSIASDVFYRVFGILNAVIITTTYPVLSSKHAAGRTDTVKKIYRKSIGLYLATGALILIMATLLANKAALFGHLSRESSTMTTTAFFAIGLSALIWQHMSVFHKPYELALNMKKLVFMMFGSLVVFAGSVAIAAATEEEGLNLKIALALVLTGLSYHALVARFKPASSGAES